MRSWWFLVVLALLFTACTSDATPLTSDSDAPAPTVTSVSPTVTPTEVVSAAADVDTEVDVAGSEPSDSSVEAPFVRAGGVTVEVAPLGSFVVARANAGMTWQPASGELGGHPDLVIAVYDAPGGEPRVLQDVNALDGISLDYPLLNWGQFDSPLVLRVLAGNADDEWLLVQSPSRPHDRSVWVRSEDFDFDSTTRRIEIDIAGEGELVVYDDPEVLLRSSIVHGRESRVTPTHQTYLVGGVMGRSSGSPAYGYAQLEMASFSEVLGTFGGGGAPKNYLHGTNQPELMGQRVSSGEIRVTNEVLEEVIGLVGPGTPITLFDSSKGQTPQALQERSVPGLPAPTEPFITPLSSLSPAVGRNLPQLWEPCAELICLVHGDAVPAQFDYAVAVPRADDSQIPVYDERGGIPRTIVDVNDIDGTRSLNPLYAETSFDQQLVLRVIEHRREEGWLKVQVPTRPNHSHVWVQADDFEVRTTNVWIEASIAPTSRSEAGQLWVYRDGLPVFSADVASGRDSRPTPLGTGWVGQLVEGEPLSPAYGPWVIDLGTFSETLGTFGGGGAPLMVVHGTNQPELIGTRVTSGALRLSNDDLNEFAAIEGLIGAPVHIHASNQMAISGPASFRSTGPAMTTNWSPDAARLVVVPL